jgi:TetR/AcrR family transcriptional regulator, lmrAB and yxaGH operons repressor
VPPRLVSDAQLISSLTGLFRDRGFDAATMAEIAEATGLQKSSLYHRFPGGKQQMAEEVATEVGAEFANHLLAPLTSDLALDLRVRQVAKNLAVFYENGNRACLLEALSLGTVGPEAASALRSAAMGWVEAFATVARLSGATRKESLSRAHDALAMIEGGLVVARVTGESGSFLRALDRLPVTLLG